MEEIRNSFSFLTIGKTQESTEGTGSFKRYVGVGSSYVLAVNPNKTKLDELMGFESQNEPEYVKDGDNGKEAHVHFVVRTDPESNNGIEITTRLMITLRNAPAYNKDQSKVQVIDGFGNHVWMATEDAKMGKPALQADGNPCMLDTKYRMACVGECDLVDLLKAYLVVPNAFSYVNGIWVKKENPDDGKFALENIKDYFKGDFSELTGALALQPNNKVKLLYGVRTTEEGKQYQVVASRGDLILPNAAGSKGLLRLERNLANAKQSGSFATTEFKVQELQEYVIEATNLEKPAADTSSDDDMPW